jgi:hypothetical protein
MNHFRRAINIGENSLFCMSKNMKQAIKVSAVLFLAISLIVSGCSASKKGGSCGCPNKQGMVGYR